jgi:hypothetical protein
MPITETQSFAFLIRDTIYDLVTPAFSGYKLRKNRMLPVQPDQLPYLGIYLAEEVMTPDGDANAGCVRFSHTARIGFSVVIANNDPVVAEQQSDQAFLLLMKTMFTDLHFMQVVENLQNDEGVMVESVVRGTRRHIFGSPQNTNETPFVELQYEVNFFFRTEWYPDITDTLNEIDVKTLFTTEQTSDSTGIEQVEVVYDFTSSRKEQANGERSDQSANAGTEAERKAGSDPGGRIPPRYPGGTGKRETPRRPKAPVRYSFPRDR